MTVSAVQVATTRAVVRWYLQNYRGTTADLGLLPMYFSESFVGAFSVTPRDVRRGEPTALFRMLVVTTMFQRLRDALVFKILRGISTADAHDLTTQAQLLEDARACGCPHLANAAVLAEHCDLTKKNGKGICAAEPTRACPLKTHTVLLKRYGHFGKMPTSAALAVHEHGGNLRDLVRSVCSASKEHSARAELMLERLKTVWRISDKIGSMFLSALTNPDLNGGIAPWSKQLDGSHFVVVDSNVDLFLAAVGYRGTGTYSARRAFVQALAKEIDLREFDSHLTGYNPRLIQQAMYIFMGRSNRRENPLDCSFTAGACVTCPKQVRNICPLRRSASP